MRFQSGARSEPWALMPQWEKKQSGRWHFKNTVFCWFQFFVAGQIHQHWVRWGLLADGLNSILAVLMTSPPNTTFSQNNGVIAIARCASRAAGIACCIWLILSHRHCLVSRQFLLFFVASVLFLGSKDRLFCWELLDWMEMGSASSAFSIFFQHIK